MATDNLINTCTWLVASGPSQVELVVIDWLRRWIGYPESAGGLLTSGGSAASLDAFVAARERAGHPERATVYMSDQSHSAQVRAARIVGVRPECIRMVPSDGRFRLDAAALARAVAADRAAGFTPIAVCANAGAGSTGAIDPLEAMADYCEAEGIWLHVDGAYGGFAAVTERGRQLLAGIERADSVGMDAHKWFFQPYEAGCLLVKDVGADLRHGRVPARRVAGHGARSPRRGTHPEEPPAGAAEPRVTGDRVLSDQSRRRRSRRAGPGKYELDRARPRLLGRPRVHVVDAAPQDVFPPALHRQPHHDVG